MMKFENRYMEGMVSDDVDQDLMDLVDVGLDLEKRQRKRVIDTNQAKHWQDIRNKERQKQMTRLKTWRQAVGGGHPFQFFNEKRLDALENKRRAWTEHLLITGDDTANDPDVYKASTGKISEFSSHEQEEYERLKQEGFVTWGKSDFLSFISGSTK